MDRLNEHDFAVLKMLATYYVLTREQIQTLCFPEHLSGRATRKRLTRLRQAGFLSKHKVQIQLPGRNGAAPVYYITGLGAESLASYFDDPQWLAANTKHPRADRVCHWIAISDIRIVVEAAIAQQTNVRLDNWVTEWQTINPLDAEEKRFCLHTQLSKTPPLSCSPDAGFVLSMGEHKKVFYLEADLGTSSPKQVAARKTKGYAALAEQQLHRKQFPETTLSTFSVLLVTTNRYRTKTIAEEVQSKTGADLWLFMNRQELTTESFLQAPIVHKCNGEVGPLVKGTTT